MKSVVKCTLLNSMTDNYQTINEIPRMVNIPALAEKTETLVELPQTSGCRGYLASSRKNWVQKFR
jgi:hypothetical protein